MYEGKNIHYSQTDQKPLCSFSGKICNQRRLNNYGFCVRHILEDTTAPFKQCAYVAKSSRQTCTQPIPKQEEREYCNNHMQVLGMLPKKERKPKNAKSTSTQFVNLNAGAMSDPGLLQNKLKPKLTAGSLTPGKITGHRLFTTNEEGDDVYTFPTDNNEKNAKTFTALVQNVGNISVVGPTSNSISSVTSASKGSSDASSGQSSLAKIYPELAEKLEKIKPKIDTAKLKGKVKSSRTMNRLQTKIAQNKIKDKLKRNQSSSNTSSQSQSPSHSFMSSSPGYHVNTSSPNHVNQTSGHSSDLTREQLRVSTPQSTCALNQTSASTLPCLSNLNLLNGLNLQTLNMSLEQLGLPVQTVGDIEQTLKQLAKSANIPLDGSSLSESQPVSQTSEAQNSGVLPLLLPPSQTFTPQVGPPPPYPGVPHKSTATVHHISSQGSPVKQPTPPVGHQIVPVPISTSIPTSTTTVATSTVVNVPLVTKPVVPSQTLQAGMTVPLPAPPMLAKSALSQSLSAISLTGSFATFPTMIHPNITLLTPSQPSSAALNAAPVKPLTQEPVKQASATPTVQQTPGVQTAIQSQTTSLSKPKPAKTTKPRSRNPSASTKRPVPLFSLPMTVVKPRKLQKMLDENEVKTWKKKSAIELYNKSIKRKFDHHYMIYPGLVSSDDSDGSDCDPLPWQRDWLTPSSDEEVAEDDYTLRTAKLALCRARQRRQCFQSRRSSKARGHRDISERSSKVSNNPDETTCLIRAARDSPSTAARCILEVNGVKVKTKDKYKLRGTEKRQCLYRDNDDIQCKNSIVPYTNHCIKHVMYNVDQQLFEYCTAKFADNTQCCRPVIDVKHELPLCMEHGLKADNFLKAQDAEPKPKKPRKKTKPSALTRPPKKGKKKKNQRKNAARQAASTPVVEDTTGGDTDIVESSEEIQSQERDTEMKQEDQDSDADKPEVPRTLPVNIPSPLSVQPVVATVTQSINITPVLTVIPCTASQVSKLLVADVIHRPLLPQMTAVSNQGSVMSAQLKSAPLNVRPLAPGPLAKDLLTSEPQGPQVARPSLQGVSTSAPVVVKDGIRQAKSGSLGQLEEFDNLTGLSVLENVKMFSDLETTASKLLEENDFQDVFNKLPDDVTFDLFNNKGSTEDLQYLEDSLALASREMNTAKEAMAGPSTMTTASSLAASLATRPGMVSQGYPQGMGPGPVLPRITTSVSGASMPMFEDDFTRQMAEEVLKQNIGPASITMANSMCNGDAEASIAAIARSLSNTGQLLAAEAEQKSKSPDIPASVPNVTMTTSLPANSVSRTISLPAYSTLEYFPPNVVIQNLPLSSNPVTTVGAQGSVIVTTVGAQGSVISNKAPMQISQVFAGPSQSSVIPQNVTVTPQGIITSHIPVVSTVASLQPQSANVVPYTQTVTIGSTAVTGNQAAGIITLPTPQQLTAQQLSALVQQAAAQLPPLPPYKPRQQRPTATTSHTVQHTATCIAPSIDISQRPLATLVTGVKPVPITSSTAVTRQTYQPDLVVQQLTKQQEQILAQQLLQQKIATITPQTLTPQTIRMSLPSTQSLGFSAVLQHGQIGRLNQGVVQAVPNLGQIAQLIKPDLSTSQPLSTPISLPTTNIVWTSPPNVTITSPNGLPRQNLQPKTVIPKVHATNVPSSSVAGPIKETFIDLTESDPPPYEATQSVRAKSVPPPSYPIQTSTNSTVTGKS